jgi:hypothetical protein
VDKLAGRWILAERPGCWMRHVQFNTCSETSGGYACRQASNGCACCVLSTRLAAGGVQQLDDQLNKVWLMGLAAGGSVLCTSAAASTDAECS